MVHSTNKEHIDREEMLPAIPLQLQKDGIGFVRLKPRTKEAFERKWQKNPCSLHAIQTWIASGGNYGVMAGYGGLVIVDTDVEAMSIFMKEHFPRTFTVKSPRRGWHYYFFCKDQIRKANLTKNGQHCGEIIGKGAQAVGPGSIHPETGTRYAVAIDAPIAEVSRELLFFHLAEYIKPDYFYPKQVYNNTDGGSIAAVLNTAGIVLRQQASGQLIGSHPVHGSTHGTNFAVHPRKNVWHCFRCGSGGGTLSLIAVLERKIDCHEAKPRALRGTLFKEVVKIAEEKYGLIVPKPSKKTAPERGASLVVPEEMPSPALADKDTIHALEAKIKALPNDAGRLDIPALLDPILRELAVLSIEQADVLLHCTVKEHFTYTDRDLRVYSKKIAQYRKELSKSTVQARSVSREDLLLKLKQDRTEKSIHPAQDFLDGVMSYAVAIQGQPGILTSDKRLCLAEDAEKNGLLLKQARVSTADFSRHGIIRFIEEDYKVDIAALYQRIYLYIKRFICFPKDAHARYLALWVMGTYVFKIFRYYPYIWLNAEKGSGKTLLMEILSMIAFHGELITNPTESVIFRDIANNLTTMFIDEVEELRRKDKDMYGTLISILNAGFCETGVVKRSESDGAGNFITRSFSAYSPKMFAGINEIDDVLVDRTVRIAILRRKRTEPVERYKKTKPLAEVQTLLKDDLYVFGLTYGNNIAQYYQKEGEEGIQGLSHLENRELDIWEPIMLLANMVDACRGSTETTSLMEQLSKELFEKKQKESNMNNETAKLLTVLKSMLASGLEDVYREGDIRYFDAHQVLDFFKEQDEFSWMEKTNVLTKRLKRLEIFSEQIRVQGEKKQVYKIGIQQVEDLCARYCGA